MLGPFSTDMLDSELGYWLTQEHCLDEDSDSDSDFEQESSSEDSEQTMHPEIGLYSVQPQKNGSGIPIQQNAAAPHDFRQIIPEPIVIMAKVNGHTIRALLDSSSLSDFNIGVGQEWQNTISDCLS